MCTSIYSIEIYWELLVKFSYDSYEILSIKFILVMLLVLVTSSCYNTMNRLGTMLSVEAKIDYPHNITFISSITCITKLNPFISIFCAT